MMYNKLTIGDLRALRTMMSNSNAGETIDIGKFPELKKRWAFIVPKLQEQGLRLSNITHQSISFISEQSFDAFAAHIEDWLEESEAERKGRKGQIFIVIATCVNTIVSIVALLCALMK